MADQDFDLPSGAKQHVTIAPFEDAHALTKALLKSSVGLQLAQDVLSMDLTALKDGLIAAATSDEVEKFVFKCLERSTWNNLKITKALFDDPTYGDDARKDYYLLCANVVRANCAPFFGQALSMLRTSLGNGTVSQGQK